MKILYLMRHAKAETSYPGINDHSRKLTDRGLADAARMANQLKELIEVPELIVCSTSTRTKSTANQVSKILEIPEKQIETSSDLYNASVSDVLFVIQSLSDAYKTIMLVGHNPAFTYMAFELCGHELEHLPTAGIIKVSFNSKSWKMAKKGKFEFVISPKD